MFTPIRYDSGKLASKQVKGSTAFVKGNALMTNAGYLTNATSGSNFDVRYVAMETKTTGASDGEYLLVIETNGVEFIADTSNTPTQAQVDTYVDLSAAGTLDTSAVTDQLFYVNQIEGAPALKQVRGYFNRAAPNA